ncbi:hypothetical protein C725_2735 [Pacificimonas flava]|uniref:Uncharacterized protein n=1 Tax=Pacificimonas flava TaxID=1234595 RepID=M2TJW1_9SPHN|nr:hypothetical protein C725_2735 [Pacificimonas flava]
MPRFVPVRGENRFQQVPKFCILTSALSARIWQCQFMRS